MSVITVGSGMQYATIKAAVAAAHDGDTIFVQAGTYVNDFATVNAKITMQGIGGMVHMVATSPVGKGMITMNQDLTIDHFEFSGAKNSDRNAAGIRIQNGDLTVTNSYFHDNQDGVLGGGTHPNDDIVIDHTEFAHNGAGDGKSHNLYIAQSHSLTVTNSYLHDAVVGHELKSRAEITTILNNRIADYDGTGSYDIDLGKGGLAVIRGNYIQQGPNTQNPTIINYGGYLYTPWDNSQLIIEDNIIVNQLTKHPIGINNRFNYVAQISNNHFYGLTPSQIAVGLNVQSGNDTLTQLPTPDTSHPWAANAWDDIIWNGAAANTLIGPSGHDLFAGSSGSDTFVIQSGGNNDTIAGFDDPGAKDVVRLEGYGFSSFAGVQAAMNQQGSNVVLDLGNGETLTFQGKSIGDFTAADFTFSSTISATSGTSHTTTTTTTTSTHSDLGTSDREHLGTTSTTTTTTQTSIVHPTLFKLPETGAPVNNFPGDKGNNVLTGTNLNDRMYGQLGADTMSGGGGDDSYQVENVKDLVIDNPNSGIDTVGSTLASYTLPTNVENLSLSSSTINQVGIGNALNNLISSANGNDTIDGGAGNDILKTGTGAYSLTGGTGNDIFVFTSGASGQSTITDFHAGEDLIDMRKVFSAAGYKGTDPLADHAIEVVSDGHGGSLISIDPTHSGVVHPYVDVQGAAPSELYIGLDVLWH